MAPIIKKEHVAMAIAGQSPAPRRRGHAKVATLLQVEGEVRAIEVVCTCGEKTVIELEYDEGAAVEGHSAAPAPIPQPPVEDLPATESGAEEEMPS